MNCTWFEPLITRMLVTRRAASIATVILPLWEGIHAAGARFCRSCTLDWAGSLENSSGLMLLLLLLYQVDERGRVLHPTNRFLSTIFIFFLWKTHLKLHFPAAWNSLSNVKLTDRQLAQVNERLRKQNVPKIIFPRLVRVSGKPMWRILATADRSYSARSGWLFRRGEIKSEKFTFNSMKFLNKMKLNRSTAWRIH